MPNRNYIKGRAKEYKFIKEAKEKGFIAFRSAGSHSPIDVCIIDISSMKILFIQCKPDSMSVKEKDRICEEYKELNGVFNVTYEVR